MGTIGDRTTVPIARIKSPKWGAGSICPIPSGKVDRQDITAVLGSILIATAMREAHEELGSGIRPLLVGSLYDSRTGFTVHTAIGAAEDAFAPNQIQVDGREYDGWQQVRFGELPDMIERGQHPFAIGTIFSLYQAYRYLADMQSLHQSTGRMRPRQ